MAARRRRVEVLPPAQADLKRLSEDDPRLLLRAQALLTLLGQGKVTGKPLTDLPRYGDMKDCRKIYFGVLPGAVTHRIVYREREDGGIEVDEVVAVEARAEGYVYFLAAKRLGRLPPESEDRYTTLHQRTIASRSGQRRGQQQPPARRRRWREAVAPARCCSGDVEKASRKLRKAPERDEMTKRVLRFG